jgi:excinuclease UvrABC nuclease subunit
MKRFRRTQVYSAPGKTNIKEAIERAGVYMIYKDRQLRYIGHSSSNIYKTLLRHFQNWDDPKQIRVTYPQTPLYKVTIIFTTEQQAPRLERWMIKRYKPIDNPEKYEQIKLNYGEIRAGETFLDTPTDTQAPF